jgi:hypothetical protein
MRRRPPEVLSAVPRELIEPRLWPQCERVDGGFQPCSCWCSARRREFVDGGGEWPGASTGELTDLLDLLNRHPCNEPFDPAAI